MREQRDEGREIDRMLGSLDIPSIDIGDVADRFEGIERNADRQDHMRECERLHAHRLQHFIETADAEVRVFEIRQRRQIDDDAGNQPAPGKSEEHTSELQSLMRNSYAVFCLTKIIKQKK